MGVDLSDPGLLVLGTGPDRAPARGGRGRRRGGRTASAEQPARPVRPTLVEERVALPGGEIELTRPRDPEALLSEEAFEHEEFLPYWAELWTSGVALAHDLARRSLRGARTLELGCGLALPSIAAARAGGRVLATDWSADAVAAAASNAAPQRRRDRDARVRLGRAGGRCSSAPRSSSCSPPTCSTSSATCDQLLDLLPRLVDDARPDPAGRSRTARRPSASWRARARAST